LVKTYERVSATLKKLEKISLVAHLLTESSAEELPAICYMLTGNVFPDWSARKLEVGGSTIWDCVCEVAGVSSVELAQAYDRVGDLGMAAEAVLKSRPQTILIHKPLSVSQTHSALTHLAEIRGRGSNARKRRALAGLLRRATPTEAKFIIKTITGDMRAGFKKGLLLDSIARAFSVSQADVRRAYMMTADVGEVAQVCRESGVQGLRRLTIKPGRPVKHMLAETAESLAEGLARYGRALFEFKYDGARLEIHKADKIHIFTRKFEDVTHSLPEIVRELETYPHTFIIDGELIPYERGPQPFQQLIRRLRRKHRVSELATQIPVRLYAFDLLYLNGKQLIDLPLIERRHLLEAHIIPTEHIQIAQAMITDKLAEAERFFDQAIQAGYEGVMIKNPHSTYKPGRRGRDWLKVKPAPESLDLVVIAVEYGHGKRARVLSDYTFAARDEEGKLTPVAKAYCGLTDQEIARMTRYFKQIAIRRVGRRYIVQPRVVVEVEFGEIQKSPHYPSGYALRFPRIRKIHPGKRPEEADTVAKIEEIFRRQRRRLSSR
jgi:DNA ligase-1